MSTTQRSTPPSKTYSLKGQISTILITVIMILTILAVILLGVLVQTYQLYHNERRMNALNVYAEELDSRILQMNDVAGSLYSDANFQKLNTYQAKGVQYEDIYSLLNTLKIQVRSNQSLEGLFVFYNSGEDHIHSVQESMSYQNKEILSKTGRLAAESMLKNTYHINYDGTVVSAKDALYYNIFLKKTLATIMATVRLDVLLTGELDEAGAYGIIFNNTFYPLAETDLEPLLLSVESLSDGRAIVGNQVYYLKKLSSTNLYVVEIIPQSIWLYISRIHILLAILILALVFALYRFYRMISRQISEPLEDMTKALQQIQAGIWEVDFQAENHLTEIENVRNTVKLLLSEINQYKIRSYEEKLEHQKTKLQFLSLQLAPHFYTNCLKNAYYMLMLEEYDHAAQFLLCLSTHLRYLLNSDLRRVKIQAEKEFLENYITMQQLMTDKPLLCDIAIAEDVLEEEIPVLALQTFVENSVKYTRGNGGQDLKIQVKANKMETEDGCYLVIQVKDNGSGYPEEVLAMLNDREPAAKGKLGVGIVNLLSRVRLQFGERATWYFENRGGAASELLLPLGEENTGQLPIT